MRKENLGQEGHGTHNYIANLSGQLGGGGVPEVPQQPGATLHTSHNPNVQSHPDLSQNINPIGYSRSSTEPERKKHLRTQGILLASILFGGGVIGDVVENQQSGDIKTFTNNPTSETFLGAITPFDHQGNQSHELEGVRRGVATSTQTVKPTEEAKPTASNTAEVKSQKATYDWLNMPPQQLIDLQKLKFRDALGQTYTWGAKENLAYGSKETAPYTGFVYGKTLSLTKTPDNAVILDLGLIGQDTKPYVVGVFLGYTGNKYPAEIETTAPYTRVDDQGVTHNGYRTRGNVIPTDAIYDQPQWFLGKNVAVQMITNQQKARPNDNSFFTVRKEEEKLREYYGYAFTEFTKAQNGMQGVNPDAVRIAKTFVRTDASSPLDSTKAPLGLTIEVLGESDNTSYFNYINGSRIPNSILYPNATQ